jgi:hypothetical protein
VLTHFRHRLRLVDAVLALLLFGGYLGVLLSTMQMGFTRDEGYYFHAALDYHGWFEELERNRAAGRPEDSFTQANIDRHWGYNPEHPVLMKTLFALSWDALSQEREILSQSTAMRFPAAVLTALLVALVFLFSVEAFGSRVAGVFAALTLGFMPHVFFHGHLACFDAPITTFWFLVVYAYWRSLRSTMWGWLTGVFFGLALITKLNAFFIPVALLVHWVIAGLPEALRERRAAEVPGRRFRLPAIPVAFVAMAVLGPLIFYLGWPRHWFDTFNRIAWYIGRHVDHEHYFVEYFGQALVRPPFPVEFPFVMTLLTVPAVTLAATAVGSGAWLSRLWRRRRAPGEVARDPRATGLLVFLNALLPILVIAQPGTPVFGGTKHWMPSMPYLSMLAGLGAVLAFRWAWTRLPWGERPLWRALALAGFLALLLWPSVRGTFAVHPFGSSYYNELAGGVRGAADLGLIRQFWGDNTRAGLAYLNEIAPPHSRVFPHDANWDDMHWYRREGLLREDIRDAWEPERAHFAFFNHQRAFVPVAQHIWRAMGTKAPVRVWTVNGVPELSLYASPEMRALLEGGSAD